MVHSAQDLNSTNQIRSSVTSSYRRQNSTHLAEIDVRADGVDLRVAAGQHGSGDAVRTGNGVACVVGLDGVRRGAVHRGSREAEFLPGHQIRAPDVDGRIESCELVAMWEIKRSALRAKKNTNVGTLCAAEMLSQISPS